MRNTKFKNWRSVLFLTFSLLFLLCFLYIFIVEKKIIQIIKPQSEKPVFAKKEFQISTNPDLLKINDNISWSKISQKTAQFLTDLQIPVQQVVKFSYKYQIRNKYHVNWTWNYQNLEKYVIFRISDTLAFLPITLKFIYFNNQLTVKIVIGYKEYPSKQPNYQFYQIEVTK